MAKADHMNGRGGISWSIISWGIVLLLLLLPYLANAPWTPSDYVFAAVLLGSVGLAFEFILRRPGSLFYRAGGALAVIATFLTVWVNAAVGMIGSEDNPYNLLFLAVPVLALIVAIAGRFRAAGMLRAMAAAALAQAALGAFGLSADPRGGVLSIVFAATWVLAAACFWIADRRGVEMRTADHS